MQCEAPGFPQVFRCLDELFARPRADTRVLFRTLCHVLLSARTFTCCAWSAGLNGTTPLSLRGAVRGGVRLQNPGSDLLLHVAILSRPLFAEGLCENAIVTPEPGCSGSRVHVVIRVW